MINADQLARKLHDRFDYCLVPWDDLPKVEQQAYLSTAKAVLRLVVPQVLNPIVSLVNAQAASEGLWFRARTAPEGFLQRELRQLHALIEELRDRWLEEGKK